MNDNFKSDFEGKVTGSILDINQKTISFSDALAASDIRPKFDCIKIPEPDLSYYSNINIKMSRIGRWSEDVTEEVAVKALNDGKTVLAVIDNGGQTLMELYKEHQGKLTEFPKIYGPYASEPRKIVKIHVWEVNINE